MKPRTVSRNSSTVGQSLFLAAFILFGSLVSLPRIARAEMPPEAAREVQIANADLDELAREIAKLCAEPGFRGFLRSEIAKSKNRENILELSKFLDKAQRQRDMPPGLAKVRDITGRAKGRLKTSGINELAKYDLYIPVDAHRKKWQGGKDFLVAFAPLGHEEDVEQIVAYSVSDGERVLLDPNKAPNSVVLVVAPEEHETHAVLPLPQPDKKEPLPQPISKQEAERMVKKPTGKEPLNAEGNSFFQLRYLNIYDDKEPWTKGDPEIYVVYAHGRYGQPLAQKVSLPGVNEENRYYWTGSSNQLYFVFDTTYTNHSYVAVWESDGPSYWSVGIDIIASLYRPTKSCSVDGVTCEYSHYLYDDFLGEARTYKSLYPWGYEGHGLYIPTNAHFKVAKWH